MRIVITILFWVVVATLVIIFAIENIHPLVDTPVALKLDLHWVKWSTGNFPLAVAIVLAFLIGFFLSALIYLMPLIRLTKKNRLLNKQLGSHGGYPPTPYDSDDSSPTSDYTDGDEG